MILQFGPAYSGSSRLVTPVLTQHRAGQRARLRDAGVTMFQSTLERQSPPPNILSSLSSSALLLTEPPLPGVWLHMG